MASIFRSIEINGTFYSMQRPDSFAEWADATPDDFIFAVKGPRHLTHMLKLRNVQVPLGNFFALGVLRLGPKLGPGRRPRDVFRYFDNTDKLQAPGTHAPRCGGWGRREMATPKASAAKLARGAKEARSCTRCPLYRNAMQTVFGEGPVGAGLMLVGEQPGDQEDIAGHPFVGPAGKMLDRALADAGIDRTQVYVTNAVKHFKNEPRGKKRLHKKPNRHEVEVCKVWLTQEVSLVKPGLVLAMGVTAAEALAGRPVTLARERGKETSFGEGQRGMVTVHPSSILRVPDQAGRHKAYAGLVRDLKLALKVLQAA